MRTVLRISIPTVVAALFLAAATDCSAGPLRRAAGKDQEIDMKELPLPVIESAQKEVPNIAFMKVQKHTSWRRSVIYAIWAMDGQQRQIYMEIDSGGKVVERPKVVPSNAKEKQG
jgi:hypothetical protein